MKNLFLFSIVLIVGFLSQTEAQISANWKPTGPIAFPINVSGQINGIGRVCQLKFHPSNASKIYAVSASGGLWISNDAGLNWHETGTDNLPASSCASVCIDFTNDSILYLGTGDPNYYNNSLGIWKSSDAGATWNASNTGIGMRLAVEILMNPSNRNELIAATNDGIWKSYNAGQSWVVKKSGGAFKDMKFKASLNSDTVFAVTNSQYYRSTNMGDTWTQITNGVFVPNGNGEGMRLAVSSANAACVYIGMIADGGTILKSMDGGTSFTTVYHNASQSLVGYDAFSSGQGNYNFGISADPQDANTIFVAAHCVWRSNDAGANWLKLTSWASDCHTDMHQIIYNPYNHSDLLNANDGGVFVSHDAGDNWDPFSDGLGATECYHAAQSPLAIDLVSIGTQDNGELFYDGQWKTNRGGDWTEKMAFDYIQFNRVYYFNGDRRTVTGSDQVCLPSVTNALLFTPQLTNLCFSANLDVHRTLNLNANSPSWTLIATNSASAQAMAVSPIDANDLYIVLNNSQIKHSVNALAASPTFALISAPSTTANAASIAVLKSNPTIIYLSCGNKVYRSSNQGTTWINITYGLPAVNIKKVYIDDYSPIEAVYVCSAVGVYFKNDTMNYWANYSQGLPKVADIRDFMITNVGTVGSKLRVAYYGRGVWESNLYQPYLLPQADFTADDTQICKGATVNFLNASSANTLNYYWTFAGGNPTSSMLKNPSVTYNSPGSYFVSLLVSNAAGLDSLVKTAYIDVQGTNTIPFQEQFSGSFPPSTWSFVDAGNDGINWMQSTTVGGYGASSECMFFDNYNLDVQGKYDGVRTLNLNLTSTSHAELKFDVAYAPNSAPFFDTLAVFISTDCGSIYTQVYLKDALALATAPASPNVTFVPTSAQWRTEVVNLDAFVGNENVSILFQNRGNAGQELYIDNVTVSEPLAANFEAAQEGFLIYPNPTKGKFTVEIQALKSDVYTFEFHSLIGKRMNLLEQVILIGYSKIPIDVSEFSKGVYFLEIRNKKGELVKQQKIVLL